MPLSRFRATSELLSADAGTMTRSLYRIGLEAVLQEPCETKHDLPFVITTEVTSEQAIREAVEEMSRLDFLREAPLALPMETAL